MHPSDEPPINKILRALESSESAHAWREFLEIHAPVLQQVVHLFQAEPDEAADCFVYVCEQLSRDDFRRLRRFRSEGPAQFTTWLRAVVRNLCIDWRRHRFGRQRAVPQPVVEPLGDMDLADHRPNPETAINEGQRFRALRGALAGLPAEDRLLVRLRFERELTLQQVARLAGLKDAQTADRRLRQILQRMRDVVELGKAAGLSV